MSLSVRTHETEIANGVDLWTASIYDGDDDRILRRHGKTEHEALMALSRLLADLDRAVHQLARDSMERPGGAT